MLERTDCNPQKSTYKATDKAARRELPRTPAEEVVAAVWGSSLGINEIGIQESFFELGGHSLLASQIILQLREIFRIDLPLHSLFETFTVDRLVNVMAQIAGGREIIEEIAWTFIQVQQLSDEEVKVRLDKQPCDDVRAR